MPKLQQPKCLCFWNVHPNFRIWALDRGRLLLRVLLHSRYSYLDRNPLRNIATKAGIDRIGVTKGWRKEDIWPYRTILCETKALFRANGYFNLAIMSDSFWLEIPSLFKLGPSLCIRGEIVMGKTCSSPILSWDIW